MAENSSDEEVVSTGDLFDVPSDFRQARKPYTFAEYSLRSGEILRVRLVGQNPLWGHVLWNAGRVAADFLQEDAAGLVVGKDVLELGAGAGVPSIVCAILGAKTVVTTDYPDKELIDNLRHNVQNCKLLAESHCEVTVQGYLWGQPLTYGSEPAPSFDLLILADLVFNHSEHAKLIATVKKTLRHSADARALVFFTPHRPWLLEKDLKFFELAEQAHFRVTKFMEKLMDRPMYPEDQGDETLRKTVYGYVLRWPYD